MSQVSSQADSAPLMMTAGGFAHDEGPMPTTYRAGASEGYQDPSVLVANLAQDLKLQAPLEPRELPDPIEDPQNRGVSMANFDNIPSILRHRGKGINKHIALVVLDSRGKEVASIAWDKLASKAEKVAQMIRDKSGLYRGDRVTLLYAEAEVIEFAVALLGCFLAGVVAVPASPNVSFRDLEHILSSTQSHLALTTDANFKALQKSLALLKSHWPRGVEWWRTNDFGSYHPPKKTELPALQVPDLAYIEFARSPLGELKGVVMSHRTILHQMKCLAAMFESRDRRQGRKPSRMPDTALIGVDIRQSIGFIVGVLYGVYAGNTTVWMPQQAMAVGGLYANVISRYRATILLADVPVLKQVTYSYLTSPSTTRNFSKKQPVDLSSVKWCLLDSLTVDTEFLEIVSDRWLKPLGNKNAREVVTPILTLSEHGGMIISMRDWLDGHDKMGAPLNQVSADEEDSSLGPYDLSELVLDKNALATNTVQVISSTPSRNLISHDSSQHIRVGAYGYPLPDAIVAIVNPETRILTGEMSVGEIWIDSPSLSGGFWGLVRESENVFHAQCYDVDGLVDLEFLRTGLLGFVCNGKIYVLGLYEDRLRQYEEETTPELAETSGSDPSTALTQPQSSSAPPAAAARDYTSFRYHYTPHLVNTIMRSVPRVFDCSAFDIYINGEYLPVVVLESALAKGGITTVNPLSGGGTPQSVNANIGELNEVCEKCIEILYQIHKVRVFCVVISATNSLPRIKRNGRSEIGNMLCKRRYEAGSLPAAFVKFGADRAVKNVATGQDIQGGIWSPAISHIRADSLAANETQYSGFDFRKEVIDDRTAVSLTGFDSIVHILQWRVSHQSDELAYSTIDSRARESKGQSWRKFDQRVASIALHLKHHLRYRYGDAVVLMYTHSEEFVAAVYACLALGITAIPIQPMDAGRLGEDVPALLSIIKEYNVRGILVNGEAEVVLKQKPVSQHIKMTAAVAKTSVPAHTNTSKIKTSNSATTKSLQFDKAWLADDFAALVWLYWTPDYRPTAVQLSHKTILGMCKIQKETCLMVSTRPVVGCVRSASGLGFLHTCFMGAYLGASTLLVSPVDYANNPLTLWLTLSRYKVKDTYATPQMLQHAYAVMKPKGFSLSEMANIIIAEDARVETGLVNKTRILFANTGLETTSLNMAYSHALNPLVTTRSYMSLEPIDLWLDPVALRQGLVSIVNPENCPNALHLQDSGMVPINTQVAIVNPETRKLCRAGEYGEIWVYSEGNARGFFKARDAYSDERMHGKIVDGNPEVDYVRTGDLGFLHTVSKSSAPGAQAVEFQTLFVLGPIGDTFEVLGLNHFPLDIEATIERSHKAILPGGSVIFQAGGMTIVVAEIDMPLRSGSLAALVPVIVGKVLAEHQFVIDIVAFVAKGDFSRSRLGEKQRGKILGAWVTKKLNVVARYGVATTGSSTEPASITASK